MANMDKEIKDILEKCDCLDFLKFFTTVTRKSLTSCSMSQTKSKLKRLLPATEEGRVAFKKILAALMESETDSEEEQDPIKIKQEVKQEKEDEVQEDSTYQDSSEPLNQDNVNGDEDIIFLEEKPGEVSILEVKVKAEPIEISLEDQPPIIIHDCSTVKANTDDDDPPLLQPRPKRNLVRKPSLFNPVIITLRPVRSCVEKLLEGHCHVKVTNAGFIDASFERWDTMLQNYGHMITAIDCDLWTWTAANIYQDRLNLYHILSRCPNVAKLTILGDSVVLWDKVSPSFALPKLQSLKIRHDGIISYQQALRRIIIASSALDKIELEYMDESVLRTFLTFLTSLEPCTLNNLKTLSIRQMDKECGDFVALVQPELDLLCEIKAVNLEEMFLGFCVWDDTKPSMEKMLQNFANLMRLTIQGCFITIAPIEPFIIVEFPVMPRLEYLSMGKFSKYTSVLETIDERPSKRRRTGTILCLEDEGSTDDPASPKPQQSKDADEVFMYGEFFSVALNLPALPKLKTLMLGKLYDISDLHFSRFPSLEVFLVSSPWHLTVKFPSLSRRNLYSKVTQLQLPDGLQDHTFVQSVAKHFPNVQRYSIYLPNVKVIRAFSKVMLERELPLVELDMKLQFDFESSLDWAFLDKPSVSRAGGVAQSPDELEKIRVLQAYKHWKEYAQVNQIDVPNVEDLPTFETAEFRGLGALCQRLRNTLDIKIHHIPRTLRLPKGSRNWNDSRCGFTNVLIGFNTMEYPFSEEAWALAALNTTIKHFKLPSLAYRLHIRDPEAFIEIDTSITSVPNKKVECGAIGVSPELAATASCTTPSSKKK